MRRVLGAIIVSFLCLAGTHAVHGGEWILVHAHTPDLQGRIQRLHFIDEQHGWAALKRPSLTSEPPVIWTDDGGMTWHHEKTRIPYANASFADPLLGWTIEPNPSAYGPVTERVTDDIWVLRTTDGGRTWHPQRGRIVTTAYIGDLAEAPTFSGRRLRLVAFADARHGWVTGHTTPKTVKVYSHRKAT